MIDRCQTRILVIDDEPQIRRFLSTSLGAHGYHVVLAVTGSEGLRAATLQQPDLIVLDLGLPDLDGTIVLQRLREWSKVPIIILSIRGNEAAKVEALDLGADDFIVKPFGMAEFLARIRAALRHANGEALPDPIIRFDDWVIDFGLRLVTHDGAPQAFSPREYELLKYLVTHDGKVVTHQQLLRQVWGEAHLEDIQYLRVYIGQLRLKLEPSPAQPRYILTEPGVGYRFRSGVDK